MPNPLWCGIRFGNVVIVANLPKGKSDEKYSFSCASVHPGCLPDNKRGTHFSGTSGRQAVQRGLSLLWRALIRTPLCFEVSRKLPLSGIS